jgi:HEAT repeat protein
VIRLFNFLVDPSSFWIGFFTGLATFLVLVLIRKLLPGWIKASRLQFHAIKESLSTSNENRLLSDMLDWAQHQHLSAPLFPLQAVLIPPRIMAPPLPLDTANDFVVDEVTALTIPYMPDWPEAAAAFQAPTISLDEALQGGANLLLIGLPGSGKTVALADLASRMARKTVHGKPLENRVPILVHAADLLAKQSDKEPLFAISGALGETYASPIVSTRLPALVKSIFTNGRALVLVDGLDELQLEVAAQLKAYLKIIIQLYPGNQFIITVPMENFGGFNQMGFLPVAMAAWSDKDRRQFTSQWISEWNAISNKLGQAEGSIIDPTLIKNWLITPDLSVTPFEMTLKTWAAMTGDIPAPALPSLIKTHILRLTSNTPNSESIAAHLAMSMVLNRKFLISWKEAETYIAQASRAQGLLSVQDSLSEESKEKSGGIRLLSIEPDLESFVSSGLMNNHAGSQIRFSHALLAGYLAGYALSTAHETDTLVKQPSWIGKHLSIGFLGSTSDISSYVNNLIQESMKVPTNPEYFQAARWLRLAQKNQPWRSTILRGLANLILKEYHTAGLSTRAVTALAVSDDPTVIGLFRQFIKSENSVVRQLAVLGIGMYGDSKTVNELTSFTRDFSAGVSRAACLGLARIGNKSAVDAVISVLLHGNEELRRAAAEVLATNTDEGLDILKEALTTDDLLVRRAAIFGLMRLDKAEVTLLLEKTAVSDEQWLVRNVASQALELKKSSPPYTPRLFPPISDLPWLLEYAGKRGVGIGNEKQAMDLIINALDRGDSEDKLRALEVLAQFGDASFVPNIYNVYYASKDELKEAAFNTIWQIGASGVPMPSPIQFGLG